MNHDYLLFRPQKESYRLNSPLVDGDPTTEGSQPVPCAAEVIEFRSIAEKNWIETLPPGGNLEGFVLATCYATLDDRTGSASGYVAHYENPFGDDCAVVSRDASDPRKYTVDATAAQFIGSVHVSGCAAVIHSFERQPGANGYVWDHQFIGTSSSPLNLTITLQKSV
jgi:hypothetical protein